MDVAPSSIAFLGLAVVRLPEGLRLIRRVSSHPPLEAGSRLASDQPLQVADRIFTSGVRPLVFPLRVNPGSAHVTRAPRFREAGTAPAISPTPSSPSFLQPTSENLVILQPRFERCDQRLAPSMVLLPLPLNSAGHRVSLEPELAVPKSAMARPSWKAAIIRDKIIRDNMTLKTGKVLAAAKVNPVPIEPVAERFRETRLLSAPPPLNFALRRARFYPVTPQESVLDDQVRELAERVLDPALIPLDQMRFPDCDLAHTKPTLHRCGYWVPLDARWQRKRRVWDRGARWKATKPAGAVPSVRLTIYEPQIG